MIVQLTEVPRPSKQIQMHYFNIIVGNVKRQYIVPCMYISLNKFIRANMTQWLVPCGDIRCFACPHAVSVLWGPVPGNEQKSIYLVWCCFLCLVFTYTTFESCATMFYKECVSTILTLAQSLEIVFPQFINEGFSTIGWKIPTALCRFNETCVILDPIPDVLRRVCKAQLYSDSSMNRLQTCFWWPARSIRQFLMDWAKAIACIASGTVLSVLVKISSTRSRRM